jgi:hypothetical protein
MQVLHMAISGFRALEEFVTSFNRTEVNFRKMAFQCFLIAADESAAFNTAANVHIYIVTRDVISIMA